MTDHYDSLTLAREQLEFSQAMFAGIAALLDKNKGEVTPRGEVIMAEAKTLARLGVAHSRDWAEDFDKAAKEEMEREQGHE